MTEFSPQIAEPSTFLVTGMLRRTKCASVRRALRRNPGRSPDGRVILGSLTAGMLRPFGHRVLPDAERVGSAQLREEHA